MCHRGPLFLSIGVPVFSEHLLKRLGTPGLVFFAAAALGGCAMSGPDQQGRMEGADSEAALGYEGTDWGTPFWERWLQAAREEGRAAAAASAANTTQAAQAAPSFVADSGLRPKIGLYIEGTDRNSLEAYQLTNALEAAAAKHGVTLVKPDELEEAISGTDACAGDTPPECPQLLAIYPGVRLLLTVNPNGVASGETRLRTTMVDTDFGVDYEPVATAVSLDAESARQGSDLAIWSDRIIGMAQDRISIAPWFAHTFALSGEDLYVSSGRMAGLETGDMLAVHGEGSIVRGPGGQIVAWEPGTEEGRIQIKQFIGQHMAIARAVSGRMPTPKDKLTLVEDE